MHFLVLLSLILSLPALSSRTEEKDLLSKCQSREEGSCEKLGAYYLSRESWENARLVGEALCKGNSLIGCTYAGSANLAQKKVKEGLSFLTKACDQFEPYACRSLGRFLKKENPTLSHLYFRRACHYGLQEICGDLSKKKVLFTKMGNSFLKKLKSDCEDTSTSLCQDRLKEVDACPGPLTKQDCILLPGYLSIWFRAKVLQLQGKLALTTFLAEEKKLKAFSNDLREVLKDPRITEPHRYVLGFKKFCALGNASTTVDLFPEKYAEASKTFLEEARKFFSTGKRDDCYKSGQGFEAFAVGSLDPLNPRKLDVWKINHDGNIIHVSDGLP